MLMNLIGNDYDESWSGHLNISSQVFTSKSVCLMCQESIAMLKKYNITRHFLTKQANYATKKEKALF